MREQDLSSLRSHVCLLQQDLEKSHRETAEILEAAETLEKESNKNA